MWSELRRSRRAVPFTLSGAARRSSALPRQDVRLIDGSGTPAAMVVYGHGLGAIVVVEQPADAHARRAAAARCRASR